MASRKNKRISRDRASRSNRTPALFVILAMFVVGCSLALAWVNRQLSPARPGDRTYIAVNIPSGSTAFDVAVRLARSGVVRSRYSILIAAYLARNESRLRPGVYALSPGQSPARILDDIVGGRSNRNFVIIPEGFTLKQIAVRLQDHDIVNEADFLRVARTQGRTFHCADGFTPPSNNIEGYLFPDAYQIQPGESVRGILQDMLDRFDRVVVFRHPEVRDWREPVIIASLVEREAEVQHDRPLIAAVIGNRLRIGMPLQVDATVEYALPAHKARVMYSDLRTRSPYNTYLHKGLPPGPICDPGLPSIEAALSPAPVDYLYYVQGPGGTHVFSRTLTEQDRNIAVVRSGHRPG